MKRTLFIASLLLCSSAVFGQAASGGIYRFMSLHPSARVSALGGINVSIIDRDLNLALQNPGLLNPEMHKQATFNTVNYFSDINMGYVAYAHHIDSVGTFSAGLQYINYGKFQGATAQGVPTGTFTAGDYNLVLGYGNQWKRFSYGASLKFIYSNLDIYNSFGMAVDLGGAYRSKDSLFSAGMVIRNTGYQLKPYVKGQREDIPMEIQAGFTRRLKHTPLRLSVTLHNLQTFDLTYENPNLPGQQIDLQTGEPVKKKITRGDKAMRHVIVSPELILSKNFHIRFGYNHIRRKEMTIEGKRGLVGFAWGFGLRINRFHLSYGSSSFYVGQNTNHFSVVTNLGDFKKKKKKRVVERNKL